MQNCWNATYNHRHTKFIQSKNVSINLFNIRYYAMQIRPCVHAPHAVIWMVCTFVLRCSFDCNGKFVRILHLQNLVLVVVECVCVSIFEERWKTANAIVDRMKRTFWSAAEHQQLKVYFISMDFWLNCMHHDYLVICNCSSARMLSRLFLPILTIRCYLRRLRLLENQRHSHCNADDVRCIVYAFADIVHYYLHNCTKYVR